MRKFFNFKKYDFSLFIVALALIMLGLSYISVPLYQLFCQTYGLGGTVKNISSSSIFIQENLHKQQDNLNYIQSNAYPLISNTHNLDGVSNSLISISQKDLFSFQTETLGTVDTQVYQILIQELFNQDKNNLLSQQNNNFIFDAKNSNNLKSLIIYFSADNSKDLP
jgi:hypothetical protein